MRTMRIWKSFPLRTSPAVIFQFTLVPLAFVVFFLHFERIRKNVTGLLFGDGKVVVRVVTPRWQLWTRCHGAASNSGTRGHFATSPRSESAVLGVLQFAHELQLTTPKPNSMARSTQN